MTNPIRTCVAGALVAAVALPGAALAAPGSHKGKRAGDASKRTELRAERVIVALDKAVDAIDDGDDGKAIAKLANVDKQLGRALKAANRQADGSKGPGSLGLVAETADEVALVTADSMDGAGQSLTDALESTLDGALDDRDAIVGTVGGLDDASDYDRVLSKVVDSAEAEAESFDEGVQDDELVASGETALTDASAQATATAETADTLAGDTADDAEDDDSEDGDCPPHGGPRGHRGGHSQESPSNRP